MEITPGTKNSLTHERTKQEAMKVLCLARKDHYLIFVLGVSITPRHTCARTHRWLWCDERDGYPLGAGDQLGQEHQTVPQSAAATHWEHELSVCVC